MRFRIAALLLVMLVGVEAKAERKYVFGTSIDLMGGVSNRAGHGFTFARLGEDLAPFYAVYPSLSLKSVGRLSNFDFNYAVGAERFQTTPAFTTTSHTLSLSLNSQMTRKLRLKISDSLLSAPEYNTMNVLKGFIITPTGFDYVFEPSLNQRSSFSNVARADLDVELNKRSFLTFGGSGSYRHYLDIVQPSTYLYDQFRLEGNASYSRRPNERKTLSVKYSFYQNEFKNYYTVRTHATLLGYSQTVSPSLAVSFEAGPTFTERNQFLKNYVGVNVSANVTKLLRTNRLSMYYSHRSGDSTGLGGATDSHRGGLGFSRMLGRYISINFDASAFKQKQRSTDSLDYWGVTGSMALSRTFGEHWVASLGGSYQTNQGRAGYYSNMAYKRAFVSIGYRLPEMWRISK